MRSRARILASRSGAGPDDRTAVLLTTLLVAFLAFAGVAALVPGGLVRRRAADQAGEGANLALLAAADALIAFLLGYRVAALRVTTLRDALWSAATYALAIAIGAAALRAMEIPRLLGPALLTLEFYLWDAFHGALVPTARLALGLADGPAGRSSACRRSPGTSSARQTVTRPHGPAARV